MDAGKPTPATAASAGTVETAKGRCVALLESLHLLSERTLCSSFEVTLSRLIHSELRFLNSLSDAEISSRSTLSLNVGHLEGVVHVLWQPFVTAVSRVCRPIRISESESIYVDIVCSVEGDPVWVTVSDRNPRYITWEDGNTGLKGRISKLVRLANQSSVMVMPSWILMFFSYGIGADVHQKLQSEFGAIELKTDPFVCEEIEMGDQWTNLVLCRFFLDACAFKIKVGPNTLPVMETITRTSSMDYTGTCRKCVEQMHLDLGLFFCSFLSAMKCWCCSFHVISEQEVEFSSLVNFDTTALIAIVSGISNGGTAKLLSTPQVELRARFKGNLEFVIAQANSEDEKPILIEVSCSVSGKRGIVCESVFAEFRELISMCGGPNEKQRAECILKFIKVVPDCPSTRIMSLPTTRKMDMKNKVVFGTGDHWHAPTLTANMAFVRAVRQTGVSLSVIDHRPRALIGK